MIILDKTKIEELMDLQQMMDQIEEAYRIFGKFEFNMPCNTKEEIVTKILSILPDNARLGLPSIDGIL